MSFDLSLLATKDKSEEGSWMEVLDFDWATPIGCSILVLGPDSKEAVAIADEEEKFNQGRLAAAFAGNKKVEAEVSGEDAVDKAIRKACRLTKGWKDVLWGKDVFEYTPDNAKKLYTNVAHVRVQVLNYYRERATFTNPEYASWRKLFGDDSSSTIQEKAE